MTEQKFTLKSIIPELKEALHDSTVIVEDVPVELRTNAQAKRYMALERLSGLSVQHRNAFQRDSVAILIETPETEFETLKILATEMGIISVDAQGFYSALSDIPALQGSEQFNNESFSAVISRLRELARKVGKGLPFFEATNFESHANLSFVDNARGNLRKLIGGAGPDSSWAFLQAFESAAKSLVDGPMVPVLIYNLKGGVKANYQDSFYNVELINLDKVTKNSLKEGLGEVQASLLSQGKVQSKRKTKETTKEEQTEPQGDN